VDKAPDAFRTISEVAEELETPAHVLRFWESRFPQIKPVKRAGGRRYYRPADVALLAGIRQLLHTEGMTIRGVQPRSAAPMSMPSILRAKRRWTPRQRCLPARRR
jgi:DNA-binding transcriptional MerR regulator